MTHALMLPALAADGDRVPFHADPVLAAIERHSEAWAVVEIARPTAYSERAGGESAGEGWSGLLIGSRLPRSSRCPAAAYALSHCAIAEKIGRTSRRRSRFNAEHCSLFAASTQARSPRWLRLKRLWRLESCRSTRSHLGVPATMPGYSVGAATASHATL